MLRIILAGIALVILSGCSVFSSSDNRELDDAREKWTRAGISDYSYSITVSCRCADTGTFDVVVRNDRVVSTTPSASTVKTVDELFGVLAQAYAQNAEMITASFDALLGYPTSISIDYALNAVDDEVFYTIENLERLD